MNYYEILEIREEASQEVISMAYKGLARKYHPDTYKGDLFETNEIMQKINEAYSILSKPDLRVKYDEFLKNDKYKAENIKNNEYDNDLIHKPSMNFSGIYTKFLLPLEALILIFSLVKGYKSKVILDVFQTDLPFYYSSFMMFSIGLDLVMLALTIYLAISFRKFTHSSFTCNKIFLILFPATIALTDGLEPIISNWKVYFVAAIGILVAYIIPSLLYFEKRRFLFDKSIPREDIIYNYVNNDNEEIKKSIIKKVTVSTLISILLIVGAILISCLWIYQLFGTL